MKRILALCFFLSVLIGCGSSKKPEELLPEDKMVEILIDIHLTEGIASALPVSYDSSQVLYSLMEKDVFMKYQVEDSVFTQSMLYYLQDPVKMDRIYSRIVDSLSMKESSGRLEDQL